MTLNCDTGTPGTEGMSLFGAESCNMAFVLTNILTWELTESLICSLVHTE